VILDEILNSETSAISPKKKKKKKKNCQTARLSLVNQSINSNMSYNMELEDCNGTHGRNYKKDKEKFVELYQYNDYNLNHDQLINPKLAFNTYKR